MSEQSKVAFVVVGWNNADLLAECFGSIQDQSYKNVSIYYVDNDSKDESVTLVEKDFPGVTILQPGYNTGFAKGNNIGIKEALSDPEVGYIALLNSDATLDKKWVEQIVSFAEQKPKAALMQGTTLDYYNHHVIDSTHIFVAHNGQGTQGHWRDYYQAEFGPRKVFGVNAAACMMTRTFLEAQPFGDEVFDETMFMYLEDVDLATRATTMGWDNYLVPGARAYHMGSASSGKNPGFSLYMTFRNNSALLFKNLSWLMLIRMAPKVLRGDIDTIRELRRRGDKRAAKLVAKGRVVGILRLPLFFRKRIIARHHNKMARSYLWLLMTKGY